MNRTIVANVGVLALALSSSAYAIADACDAFGRLEGTFLLEQGDRWYTGSLANDYFGKSVATGDFDGDGDMDILVGAPGSDLAASNSGAAFLFYGPITAGTRLAASTANAVFTGEGTNAQAGWSVANAGDVNGDGIDDMLFGSIGGSGTAHPRGAAHLRHGGAISGVQPLGSTSTAEFDGLATGDDFGGQVAGVGDVNGDGFDDVMISATEQEVGAFSNAGAAYLWYGPVSGLKVSSTANAAFAGNQAASGFGAGIGRVGDINGDNFDDVVIGAPNTNVAGVGASTGIAHVWYGGTGGLALPALNGAASSDVSLTGLYLGRGGSAVSAAGDVDADGYDDYWVGSKQANSKRGAAYLIKGSASAAGTLPLETTAHAKILGFNSNDLAGTAIAGNVDFDNNGTMDVLVGAERADGAATQSGGAWAVHGPFAGVINLATATAGKIGGRQYLDFAGSAVAAADVNGDGFADALVGAWQGSASVGGANRQGVVSALFGGHDIQDEVRYYADTDNDAYGNAASSVLSCTPVAGRVTNDDDCNDGSNAFYPGAPESCVGPDTNCDGAIGTGDGDGDGYTACTECNDANALINPGRPELCGDGLDNNCNGAVDDSGAVDAQDYCPDADDDGYGDNTLCVHACTDPGTFLVTVVNVGGDCNDASATVSPDAAERCDLSDNNCDAVIDEPTSIDAATWFSDGDGDTFGDYWSSTRACVQPGGFVTNAADCDDSTPFVKPGEVETCDYTDNDCDGLKYLGGPVASSRNRGSALGVAGNDNLGSAVALIGDQNADGAAELVISAPFHDANGLTDSGVVYIVRGGQKVGAKSFGTLLADGSGQWTTRISGIRANAQMGNSLAVGDVNGDGDEDLIIGAQNTPAPNTSTGTIYVFFGPIPAGEVDVSAAGATLKGEEGGGLFGSAIAIGDVDNDGFDDILASAPEQGTANTGRVYLAYGSAALSGDVFINSVPGVATFSGVTTDDKLGTSLAVSDLDGDTYGDIVIGSGFVGSLDAGSISVAYGGPARFSGASSVTATLTGANSTERVGMSVANVGDVNNDGYEDVLIGANNARATLVWGSSSRLSSTTLAAASAYSFLGQSLQNAGLMVAGAGDVDGDGYDDMLISAQRDSQAANNAGAAYLVYGNTNAYFDGIDASKVIDLTDTESFGRVDAGTTFPTFSASNLGGAEGAKLLGAAASDQFGAALAGGRDFDGDGRPDVAVGARLRDNGGTLNVGEGYVFAGGPYGTDDDVALAGQTTYYWDDDGDSFANEAGLQFTSCPMHAPITFVPATPALRGIPVASAPELDDCNDANASIYPGAHENNNDGVDADCDGFDGINREPNVLVTLSPTTLYTDTDAVATPAGTDPDGDSLTYSYKWFVDGVEVAGATTNTLDSDSFAKGQTISVEVMANDGRDDWGPYTNSREIENSRPTISVCFVTPANADRWTDLNVTPIGLADADPEDLGSLSIAVNWQKRFGPIWQDIPGETASTLQSCNDRYVFGSQYNCFRGDSLRATCQATDGVDLGVEVPSDAVIIANAAPTVSLCSLSPTAPTTLQDVLVTSASEDLDGDPNTVSYEWLKNGVVDPGVIGNTYPANQQEHFDVIQVRCTATDAFGLSGDTVSSTPVSVVNTAPTAPAIDLLPNVPMSAEGLSVTILSGGNDDDGDDLTYDYYWTRNGSVYANPTNPSNTSTVDASATTRSDTWEVTVVSNDGYVQGGSDSDFVVIQNTPPTVDSAVLAPTSPTTSSDVEVFGVSFYDDDNDPEDYIVTWYVNGSPIGAQSPDPMVLSDAEIVRGDTVYATLQAKDPFDTGNTVTTSTITVVNEVPTSPTIAITPNPPGENDNLTCNIVVPSTDADGDTVTYQYRWYRNGSEVAGENSSTFPASGTSFADVFYCTVLPGDGIGIGDLATSPTIAIQDLNAPAAPTIASTPRYSNVSSQTLTGSCTSGPLDCNSIELTCNDGVASDTYYPSCTANAFSQVVATDRGLTTTCSAVCRDSTLNPSLASNSVTTEACGTYDAYETSGAYGDAGNTPVAEWSALADNNSANITIVGNVLAEWSDSVDWYKVDTTDNAVADAVAGANAYKFELEMSVGAADYDLWVYKNDPAGTAFCVATGPYDDFSEDVFDQGDAPNHVQAPDRNACTSNGSGVWSLYNECTSFAGSYYVRVLRASGTNCQHYQLRAYNGRP